MPKFVTYPLGICVLLWMASLLMGCANSSAALNGAGFERLTPAPASRQFIIANDIDFARQVAAHNATCAAQPGCRN
jgi:hypothetical protein